MQRRLTQLPAALACALFLFTLTLVIPCLGQEPIETAEVRDIMRFEVRNGDLGIETALDPTRGMKRVDLKDVPGITRVDVRLRSRRDIPAVGVYFRLMHSAPIAEPGRTLQTTLYTRPGYVELSRVARSSGELLSVTFTQKQVQPDAPAELADERVSLRIRRVNTSTNKPEHDVQRTAPSFVQLVRSYPGDAAEHLGPILRTFHQETAVLGADLGMAWQVLADVLPEDEEIAPTVDALVAQLDADDFRLREQALEGLRHLGGRAALLLLRLPRASLSAEQAARLDAFLADYRPLADLEAAEKRSDPHFLLNCVAYSPDPLIRVAAAEELKGHDPEGRLSDAAPRADERARISAVEAVRAELPPAVEP